MENLLTSPIPYHKSTPNPFYFDFLFFLPAELADDFNWNRDGDCPLPTLVNFLTSLSSFLLLAILINFTP